jgi:Xaa-Pro aminopeptidase
VNEKEKRLAGFCRRRGCDGVLLRRRSNIAWLTDGADVHVDSSSSTGIASLLWTPRKKVVFTTNIESRRLADEEFKGSDWEIRASNWWEDARTPEGSFATDFPADPFADLRAPLTELEIRRLREVGGIASEALAAVLRAARPGATEHQVAGELSGRLRKEGILTPVLLAASDERIARYRHPIPTSKKVAKSLLVAVCPRKWGLMVATTRLVHFGAIPKELRRRHDAVCRVDAALHAATRPGARWCDVLAEGIRAYRETGFAQEWKKHHQGGPVGYEGREFKATPSETRRILDRQAVGWNPSIAGTKSEDTILSSGEVLTSMKDWPTCGTRPDILIRG